MRNINTTSRISHTQLNHSTPNHSTPNHSTPAHSAPNHSTPGHSTPTHSPQDSSINSLLKVESTLRGALALGAACVVSAGMLAACSPANDGDAARGTSESGSVIEPASVSSTSPTIPYTKTDGGLKITVHNLLKPGTNIMVTADCQDSDVHARLTTSLSNDVIEMSPAADIPELFGIVDAPAQIGPGPADGYHTVTVTCDSGMAGTITLNGAGNDGMAPQK